MRIKVSIVPPLRGCRRYATGVNNEEVDEDGTSEEAEAEGGGVRAVLMVSMSAS